MTALLTLTSLMLSVVFLLVGHGMQLTLLPLRAALLGHSDLQIALSGSAYFSGFIVGCLLVPRLIARAGHIRSFAVLASALTSVLLVLGLSESWIVWTVLRLAIGFFICGLYSVIESWLNDQTTEENRGQVLGVYTLLVLISMAAGQQLVNASPIASSTPFMVLAAVIAISTIPVGMTRSLAPAAIESTRTRIRLLVSRSPLAVTGALLSGAVTGAFWTLGAVFARRSFDDLSDVTLFMSAAIVGGAVFQYPFGLLSDRIGRLWRTSHMNLREALIASVYAPIISAAMSPRDCKSPTAPELIAYAMSSKAAARLLITTSDHRVEIDMNR
ncbi:MFS transporter [Congregibacter sp.]|uniref:MFS transporter n=1 Tax=Congregibacter sp. TaxID=2744308 RepID=UPI003F6AF9ED